MWFSNWGLMDTCGAQVRRFQSVTRDKEFYTAKYHHIEMTPWVMLNTIEGKILISDRPPLRFWKHVLRKDLLAIADYSVGIYIQVKLRANHISCLFICTWVLLLSSNSRVYKYIQYSCSLSLSLTASINKYVKVCFVPFGVFLQWNTCYPWKTLNTILWTYANDFDCMLALVNEALSILLWIKNSHAHTPTHKRHTQIQGISVTLPRAVLSVH